MKSACCGAEAGRNPGTHEHDLDAYVCEGCSGNAFDPRYRKVAEMRSDLARLRAGIEELREWLSGQIAIDYVSLMGEEYAFGKGRRVACMRAKEKLDALLGK